MNSIYLPSNGREQDWRNVANQEIQSKSGKGVINALLPRGCRAWKADRREGAPCRSAGARSEENPERDGTKADAGTYAHSPRKVPNT
jgi:hypothetical protein